MNLDQLLPAYNQVAAEHGLPKLQADHLDIATHELDDPDAVWQRLTAFAPDSGWLCFQSRVADIRPGHDLPRPSPDNGVLLSAECHNSRSGHSLHLRQNGRGGWLVSEFHPGSGEPCLSEEVQRVAHQAQDSDANTPRRLRYRRCWTLNGDGARQQAAYFIGFDTPGGQT